MAERLEATQPTAHLEHPRTLRRFTCQNCANLGGMFVSCSDMRSHERTSRGALARRKARIC
jgi:hypothetical protein